MYFDLCRANGKACRHRHKRYLFGSGKYGAATIRRACFTLLLAISHIGWAAEPVWVLIDTTDSVARVMQGDKAVQQYDNIAIGQRGVAEIHMQGDETTPLGVYRIISVSHTSRFKLFFGLDYPTRDHAKLALMRKQIVSRDFQRIVDAHSTGSVPPSSTPLGGEIGIHGIGFGNASVHEQYNWTRGCVALSNDQIQDLARWVDIGTQVVIQ